MNGGECDISFTEKGIEIVGKCAEGLAEFLAETFKDSTKLGSEIFTCSCLDPETGNIERTVVRNIGDARSVQTGNINRVCPEESLQICYHTHPISGQAKFSSADGAVIADRFNKGYDDAHCVVGENEYDCIFRVTLNERE